MNFTKKYLTIKTYFDPDNIDDVEDFERVLKLFQKDLKVLFPGFSDDFKMILKDI